MIDFPSVGYRFGFRIRILIQNMDFLKLCCELLCIKGKGNFFGITEVCAVPSAL